MYTPTELQLFGAEYNGIPGVFCIDQGNPGPSVAVFAVTHGNEISGFDALLNLLEEQKITERTIQGKLFLIVHNLRAYQGYREAIENDEQLEDDAYRYLDSNLNRVYDPTYLENTEYVEHYEVKRAKEIIKLIPELDYVLDLHSTSRPSDPMLIGTSDREDLRIADALYFYKHIVDIFDKIPGESLLGYVKKHGRKAEKTVAIAVECGSHFQSSSKYCARKTVIRFLQATGIVTIMDVPGPEEFNVTKYQIIRNLLPKDDSFQWSRKWNGFEQVKKGAILARELGHQIIADDDYFLVMPTAIPRKHEEGVYLAKVMES